MPQNATAQKTCTLGIAGLGAIGLKVARAVDAGEVPGMTVSAVSARDAKKAAANLAGFAAPPKLVSLDELAGEAEVILECTPAAVFLESARPAIEQGRTFVPLSVGVLLSHMDLVARAAETGARIIVPTGALLGLDAIKAIAEGEVRTVRLITRKPPRGLKGAPYLVEQNISLEDLEGPKQVFAGTAREAARGFPANVNVGAALALAGIGPDRTEVEIWADPGVTRNTHSIVAESDSSRLSMTIENIPSEENPATGKITALSALATLKRLTAPLVVGT